MKTLLAVAVMSTSLLLAPPTGADPQPWCEWTPQLDVNSCGLTVGVPPTGQLVEGPGDWSQPETRTKK